MDALARRHDGDGAPHERNVPMPLVRRARVVALVAIPWVVLFSAVNLGLQIADEQLVPAISGPALLDRSGRGYSVPPLSDTFIERILGPSSRARALDRSPSSPPAAADRLVGVPTDRRVLAHAMTNDEPGGAVPITSIPFTARSRTAAASRGDDPSDCGASGGTVWYRYTPPSDLGLVAYTFGSDHAVTLGAFERTRAGWRSLGCDENEDGNALLTLPAAAGRTLWFQVAAPDGGGNLRFNLDPRGTLTVLTRAADGEPADNDAWGPQFSADWRYVAFTSNATNLARNPPCESDPPYSTNIGDIVDAPSWYVGPCFHAFVHDRVTGKTIIASSDANGRPGNRSSVGMALSGDGKVLAFSSLASNLGPMDPPGRDLFVKDLRTGRVDLIASAPPDAPRSHVEQNVGGDGPAETNWRPAISHDGRDVAFQTAVSFDPRDTNDGWDVYVYDRADRRYELISVRAPGAARPPTVARDGWLSMFSTLGTVDLSPSMSPDGRFIVFRSPAPDLVPGDGNQTWDTFVRDRLTGTTERISVSSGGQEGNGPSVGLLFPRPQISADGRFVVFDSLASNFAPGDRPGSSDVFLRDRLLGTTTAFGIDRDRDSLNDLVPHYPAISRNGRFITYTNWGISRRYERCSGHDTPIENTHGTPWAVDAYECTGHVFVYDRLTDTTFPVTVLPSGEEWWGAVSLVSEDGALVAFGSYAKNKAGERIPFLQVFLSEAPRPR